MAGNKLVASFKNTFGCDDNSDNEQANASLAVEAAVNSVDHSCAQFQFSAEQVTQEHEKANQVQGSDSDG
jgi:hypothetical protein